MAIRCPFKTRAAYVKHTRSYLLSARALIGYDIARWQSHATQQKYTQPTKTAVAQQNAAKTEGLTKLDLENHLGWNEMNSNGEL